MILAGVDSPVLITRCSPDDDSESLPSSGCACRSPPPPPDPIAAAFSLLSLLRYAVAQGMIKLAKCYQHTITQVLLYIKKGFLLRNHRSFGGIQQSPSFSYRRCRLPGWLADAHVRSGVPPVLVGAAAPVHI